MKQLTLKSPAWLGVFLCEKEPIPWEMIKPEIVLTNNQNTDCEYLHLN
jgi:hypothetical protein